MFVVPTQRRAFRFTIRTMLIIVAGLGLVLAVHVNRARRQRRAVATLEQLGASIRYDYQEGNMKAEPPGPAWLRDRLGIDYFATANFVFFLRPEIRDENLAVLHDLPQLWQVNLSRTGATGAGLVHLQGFPKLTVIALGGPNATDEALENLRDITALEVLVIVSLQDQGRNSITDAGLMHLVKLENLWRLDLDECEITDAGLVHLEGLTKLINLSLRGTRVTDRAVAELQTKLPGCRIFTGPVLGRQPRATAGPQ